MGSRNQLKCFKVLIWKGCLRVQCFDFSLNQRVERTQAICRCSLLISYLIVTFYINKDIFALANCFSYTDSQREPHRKLIQIIQKVGWRYSYTWLCYWTFWTNVQTDKMVSTTETGATATNVFKLLPKDFLVDWND